MKPNKSIRAISLILALALLHQQLPARADDTTPKQPIEIQHGDFVPFPFIFIAVGIIVGIGAGGVYVIIVLSKKLQPAPPPATPPPVPPPVPPVLPPGVTNVTRPFVLPFEAAGSPRPAGSDNPHWVPGCWSTNTMAVTNEMVEMDTYIDISGYGYSDTNRSPAAPFLGYATGSVTNLMSSTDLVTWTNYALQVWFSTNGVVTVLSDGNGAGVSTNYSAANVVGQDIHTTNQFPFGIWVRGDEKKFHRVLLGE